MQTLNLTQGSQEWKKEKLNYLGASEAPAMMGDSKHMSRDQLLDLKKGWLANPVSDFTQKLFDDGHEHEDMARQILQAEMLGAMPPIVGLNVVQELELLSSFDGYGEAEPALIWEHKDWNKTLAENIRNGVVEPHYYWQLEHQMLTAGVNEVLFMTSDGTTDNRESMVYKSVPERREKLIAGWKQFLADLENHELKPKTEKVVARVQDDFPVIECHVEGTQVVSNLGEYIPLIQSLADEQMSIVLQTDQDFADKEAFNKKVKEGRTALKTNVGVVEAQFESLDKFKNNAKQADSILQKLQSHGERQVKESKELKKQAIINDAQAQIQEHLASLSSTISGIQIQGITADWQAIIKGKRSFENMQSAVNDEIAKLKIQSNETAAIIRKNLDSLSELAGEHKFLFADHAELVLKNNEDLVNIIKVRIAEHEAAEKQRLEEERKHMEAEAEAKAKREAEQKAETERQRIRDEERAKAQKEHEAVEKQKENKAEKPASTLESEINQFCANKGLTEQDAQELLAIINTYRSELAA